MTGMKMLVRVPFCLLLIFATVFANAQSLLPVQGTAPNYYITYKIKPKESLSAVSRAFDVPVGDIMRLNGMNTKSKLQVDEEIKIPLTAKNVKQTKEGDAIALVHVVQKGETLYRISLNHNKVPVDVLKKLNNIGDTPIEIGQDIIFGYLQPKGNVSLPAIATESPRLPQPKKETVKEEVKKADTALPAATEVLADNVKKTEPDNAAKAPDTSVQNAVTNTTVETKPENNPVEKPSITTIDLSNTNADGYFANAFGKDVEGRDLKTASGTASTFKTASGWADKKYYILMNDIPPGSIVKVSSGDKAVYAKVLWAMGNMKENEGLNYRISNAAASALGISDAKFNIVVVYYE